MTMTSAVSVAPAKHDLRNLLMQGKERARLHNQSILVSLAQPQDCEINPLVIFAARGQPALYRTFWGRPDKNFWLVGKGSAVEFISDRVTSMDEVTDKYHRLMENALIEAPLVSGVGPIVLGGFRYDTQAPRDTVWNNFPNALLVLPRFLFSWSEGKSWITINTIVDAETDVVARAEALVVELQLLDTRRFENGRQPVIKSISQGSSGQWSHWVKTALQAIEGGLLNKVVLARRKVLHGQGQFLLENALEQLSRNYPECTVFAVENGKASFFGATPEFLARVDNGVLNLTCLAGTAARDSSPEEDRRHMQQLLESPKERLEHSAVVAMVTAALIDLCRELRWDNEPQILKLKNVQHLLTSVTGNLLPGNDILDVVKQLHPTPAIAGVPTDKSLEFIRKVEGDRGWYAAPIGWIDYTGGGEFAVAIRSALLSGDQAILFAGSGIVKGSSPDQEFQETEMKFQPLLAALNGG